MQRMNRYANEDEQIVMTPIKRGTGHITITMERVKPKEMEYRQNVMHVAGGDHKGIVITQCTTYGYPDSGPPELFLGLKVMLRSMSSNKKQQENWVLKFWFKEEVPEAERIENAQVFCTELVAFDGFPKDYVDFIKRTLKLMQLKYPSVQKVEVEMKKLDDAKKKKRNIDQSHDENYKSDTLRRKKAEDHRGKQKIQDEDMMFRHGEPSSRDRAEELKELQRLEELREKQRLEELREKQRHEDMERQRMAELQEKQRLEALREQQRMEELREQQKMEELRRAEELRERQRMEELRRAEEMRDRQRLEELRRAEEIRDQQRMEELRRAEELRERQRLEELRRAEEIREQQRLEEIRRAEEIRERQRMEEIREQQRMEEIRERQRLEDLQKEQRRKAEEMKEQPQDWRDSYKTDTMKARKRAEDYREKQQFDDGNKTDTMKAKKKAPVPEPYQSTEELKETDTMKARKKGREAKQAPDVPRKIAYAELSPIEKDILEVVESVYPNSLSFPAIAKMLDLPEDEELYQKLTELQNKCYLKCMKNGNYMRITGSDADVKLVRQLPMVAAGKHPTIAIITAHFCEKLAVDTMIEEKETFVKFKTEGESQVYTLGVIGAHRVVSTKLPAMGHDRGPMIAAGSVTTRLLGSFSRVEYVFLVGVGGGVAHYTDYTKHVRLGDVVISTPPDAQRSYIYMYCEPQQDMSEDAAVTDHLSIKTWGPPCMQLQQITLKLWERGLRNPRDRPWERYLKQGLELLQSRESAFCRPPIETDKLYMSLEDNLIEVGHPQPAEGSFNPRNPDMPVLHFGAVGSGRVLMRDDTSRLEFSDRHGILAFDTEFDSVVESIFGNRKDNYVFIRGIADYKDGAKKKEWQPYAALAAASVMKAIICHLEPCD